jgi:D-alanyl-D-alanine carboxypeptidase
MTRMDPHENATRGPRRHFAVVGALLVCLATAALVAAAAPAKQQATTGGQTAALQNDLDALVAAGAPGAILLILNGNHTTRLTAGLADVTRKRPMRPADHFRIASVTKSYTASVILQLVAEGKLALSDSVERRLPKLVPNGKRITIRQLLNHTSGLFELESDRQIMKPYYAGELDHYWSMRQLVQRAVTHKPLFAPGTRHSYSNTNYVVAGLIVEAVTGNSFGAELRSRIFRPLRLDQTSYPTTPRMPTPYAHGYTVLGKQAGFDITGISPSLFPASGAIISSVGDVADFYRALLSGRLLRPGLLKAMKTTVPTGSPDSGTGATGATGYGLGLMRWPTSCGPGWGHDGGVVGYWTRSYSSENGRGQAVLMINHDPETLAISARAMFQRLIARAYCSGA